MKTVKVHESHQRYLPKEIALTKIVKDNMNIIKDALPRMSIIFLTTCCPVRAATMATATKYRAAKQVHIIVPSLPYDHPVTNSR